MEWKNSLEFARELDSADELKSYRDRFFTPQKDGKDLVYLCGNSLGLQPKTAKALIEVELEDWAKFAVDAHFDSRNPWFYYHHMFTEPLSKLVGAKPVEVGVMNSLTTNLHLLMVSFYRPEGERYKILVETPTFPSDHYAVESHIRFHGNDPEQGIIHLEPEAGGHFASTEKILKTIQENKDGLALVMLSGINYYTGQFFDIEAITQAAHDVGIIAGWDLAHAAGNVPLKLHDWDVDFAVWCTYKYLNSGPGGPGGMFVHERHKKNKDLPRFAGWWGYDEESRFEMKPGFVPMEGAAGWQLSNAPVLAMSAHKAALDIFDQVGMDALRVKSEKLTAFTEFLIRDKDPNGRFELITPSDPTQRGAQLSLIAAENGRETYENITAKGIVADWRSPAVIRIAPVPLYNSFEDVFRFAEALGE